MGTAALLDNVLPPLTRVCIPAPDVIVPKTRDGHFCPLCGFKVLALSREDLHPKLVLCWISYSLSLTVSTHSRLSLSTSLRPLHCLPHLTFSLYSRFLDSFWWVLIWVIGSFC